MQNFIDGVVVGVNWERVETRKIIIITKKFIEASPVVEKHSNKVPEKYLNCFQVPRDLDTYIEDMLPSMRIALFRAGKEDKEWIIGEFMIWLLGTTKQGTPRYKIYDPVKYSKIPYYKWFLSQLKYFLMQDFRQKELERAKQPLEYREEYKKEEKRGEIYSPRYETESVFDKAYANLLPEYLQAIEAQSRGRGKDSFEAHAYQLFHAKINGEKHQTFAERMDVSPATVTHWLSKLEKVIADYFRGNYVNVVNTI